MTSIARPLTHLKQVTQYDCWHASLRMMTKWKNGNTSEPGGTHTDWLYNQCRAGQNGFNATFANSLGGKTSELDKYNATKTAKNVVQSWARTRALGSSGGTHKPFTTRPGLTVSLLPSILSENKLRAVRGGPTITPELDTGADAIGTMLTNHGPLYCLVGFGHVVVVTGVDDDELTVSDPLEDAPSKRGLKLIGDSPCVARLA